MALLFLAAQKSGHQHPVAPQEEDWSRPATHDLSASAAHIMGQTPHYIKLTQPFLQACCKSLLEVLTQEHTLL